VVAAKVLAATGIDLLTDPQLMTRAQASFKQKSGGQPYRSPIPAGQKPPLPQPPR
jgi:aminobenzoyl-glutamate utilization protein B